MPTPCVQSLAKKVPKGIRSTATIPGHVPYVNRGASVIIEVSRPEDSMVTVVTKQQFENLV